MSDAVADIKGMAERALSRSDRKLTITDYRDVLSLIFKRASTPTPDSPESERLREALRRISGGHFPEAGTLAVAGDWHGAFGALQHIASEALSPSVPQEADDGAIR